ncbi:MAG: undecaprenyl-diphosphate phosphatase [Clostridia bacterium]|nr:undecaprenyl-diphosphate phosphatase [Clostridia bacterium]
MVDILKAFIMGVIQGITEFLPVSSSGHLSLFSHFFGIDTEISGLYSSMLHIGSLVAILVFFYKTIYELFIEFTLCIKDISKKRFTLNSKEISKTRRMLFMFIISCVPLFFLFLPTKSGSNILETVESFSKDDSILIEGICFIITGVILLLGVLLDKYHKKKKNVGPLSALLIGIAQVIAACFPGISRSGTTISTGLICGVSKKNMIMYSFILSIPTIFAAGLIEFIDAMKTPTFIPVLPLVVGVVTSAVVGVLSIGLLRFLLKKNKFKYFGYYCVSLGVITAIIGIVETLMNKGV